jgi:transportin-3
LLQRGSTVGDEVKIFAAQTLRSKARFLSILSDFVLQIKYDFHQLSDATSGNLRIALLDLLILYARGPRVIMIQICISIAALGLQLKSWNTVIPDVVNACGTSGDSLEALLQFLAVLPEEAYDGRRMILTVLGSQLLTY